MKKSLLFIFSVYFAFSNLVFGAGQEASITQGAEMGKDGIKEKVRALRSERFKQMPYLDQAIIRKEIKEEDFADKSRFIAAPSHKLTDLIDRAVQVNSKAKAAHERIGLEKRRIIVALRNLFPEANFEIYQKDGKLSGDRFISKFYQTSFKQPVFHGGMLWNTLQQKRSDWDAARKDYEAVIGDLWKDVAVAYFDYNRSLQTQSDQGRVIKEMEKYVSQSKQKYTAKLISEIEFLNTESLYSQMQYDFENSKQELELAKLELQKLLDLEMDDDVSVQPLYDVESLLKKMPEEESKEPSKASAGDQALRVAVEEGKGIPELKNLMDLAYRNRAELQVDAAKLNSARLEERIRFAELLPKTDVTLEWGKLGESYINIGDMTKDPEMQLNFRMALEFKWNLGGSNVSYNLENRDMAQSLTSFAQTAQGNRASTKTFKVGMLDGLKAYVDIKDAEVARLDRVVELEKTEKEVIQDVKRAYYEYQKSQIQVRSSLQRVNYRKRLANLQKHKLDNNEVQISEYMGAAIDLLKELATLHKALSEYFSAKAKLNHAIGKAYFPLETIEAGYAK